MSNYHSLNENSQFSTHLTSKFPSLHPSCLHTFPILSARIPHPRMMCPCMALGATPYLGHDTHRLTDLPRMVWFPDSDHRLHGTKLCLRPIISTFSHYSFPGVSWFMLFLQDISFSVSIPSIIAVQSINALARYQPLQHSVLIPLGIPTAPSSPKAQNAAENDGRPRPQLGSKWVGSG